MKFLVINLFQASEIFLKHLCSVPMCDLFRDERREELPPPQATRIAPVPSRKMVVSFPRRDGGRGGRGRGHGGPRTGARGAAAGR